MLHDLQEQNELQVAFRSNYDLKKTILKQLIKTKKGLEEKEVEARDLT